MALRALFQMLILFLHLVLYISSTSDFNLVQALVQDLPLQSLLKVTTPLEDARRWYVKYIYTGIIYMCNTLELSRLFVCLGELVKFSSDWVDEKKC